MTPLRPDGAGPAAALPELVPETAVLGDLPPVPQVSAAEVAAAGADGGRRLFVLDDDPTGTQTVSGVPVLTTWSVDDLRWAIRQDAPATYVLTNTRSLAPVPAAARTVEVLEALAEASRAEGTAYVIASRSDSTLRGYYPLETDAIAATLAKTEGAVVDGVIIAPAYIEGGRLTVDSIHWVRTAAGLVPAGRSEYAADSTFGYRSSDLREWVEEKTAGRWPAGEVRTITLHDLRVGGVEAVVSVLAGLRDGRPVVVDAVTDEDLRVLALAAIAAEADGMTFVYRVGPSFVRARAGLGARAPLTSAEVDDIRGSVEGAAHGLVVAGSHVGRTTRQLERLTRLGGITSVQLDVAALLAADTRSATVAAAVAEVLRAIELTDVVVSTSRTLITGIDADASLTIAREVSSAVVDVVRGVVAGCIPRWIVAKGGITSSDVATEGLGIRRAWVRGPMLPGIVSLWQPVASAAAGVPYVVFAGNVGDDDALAAVVTTLRGH